MKQKSINSGLGDNVVKSHKYEMQIEITYIDIVSCLPLFSNIIK